MTAHYANPVRRTIVLIEMEDGTQHGYQVQGASVSVQWDDDFFSLTEPYGTYRPGHGGTITAHGYLTGLVRMPSDAFNDEPEVMPHREALPPACAPMEPHYELEPVEEPVDVSLGEVFE